MSLVNPVLEALPKVERLSPRVIRVLGLNPGNYTLQGTNTYLVGTGESRVLIDTGSPEKPDYVQLLKDTLAEVKVRIQGILLTHWHLDHTGGIHGVREMCADNNLTVSKLPLPPSPPTSPPNPFLKHLPHVLPTDHQQLTDGDKIAVDGATLVVVATPGHARDHMSLWLEEEGAVFSGDCVLGQGSTSVENLGEFMKSLRRLQSLSPSILYPGHGPVVRDGPAKIREYLEHREKRERQILSALESTGTPCTLIDLVSQVYLDLNPDLQEGAQRNVHTHLKLLEEDGRVEHHMSKEGEDKWTLQK